MRNLKAIGKKCADWVLGPLGLGLIQKGVEHYPESTSNEAALVAKCAPYTMTDEHRRWTLLKAVEYIDRNKIPGDIVECGVWRGGNVIMVKEYRSKSPIRRRLFLYDTFAGFTEPTEADVGTDGRVALPIYKARKKEDHNEWAYASLEEVKENFRRFNLLDDDVVFKKGVVEETLKGDDLPQKIALLRLDTDWYESTKIELEVLYPRLATGGVLVLDDYGSWLGSKKAVDEYFANRPAPLLVPVNRVCRMAIKVS